MFEEIDREAMMPETDQDLNDIEEMAKQYYCDGFEVGGQEAWDILAELLDDEILHKVFGSTEKFIYKKWPAWKEAKERVLEYQRNEHERILNSRVRSFINYMVQSGYTQDEILNVWNKETINGPREEN